MVVLDGLVDVVVVDELVEGDVVDVTVVTVVLVVAGCVVDVVASVVVGCFQHSQLSMFATGNSPGGQREKSRSQAERIPAAAVTIVRLTSRRFMGFFRGECCGAGLRCSPTLLAHFG